MLVDNSPEPLDEFSKFKQRLEAEVIRHNLYRIDFLNFYLSDFYFQSEFFCYLDFQVRRTHLKSVIYGILFIGYHTLLVLIFADFAVFQKIREKN